MAIISSPIGAGNATFGNAQIALAEHDSGERERLLDILRTMGCQQIRVCESLAALKSVLANDQSASPTDGFSPDLIIIDQQLPGTIGQFIDGLRHGRHGRNPFVSVIVTTTSTDSREISRLIRQGADDVVVKPISGRTLGERIEYVAVHRRPFIVTSDYVGPDRRLDDDRPSTIDQLDVPNTLLDQLSGTPGSEVGADTTIQNAVQSIVNARLEQHAQSLGVLSHLVLEAHFNDKGEGGTLGLPGNPPSQPMRTSLNIMLSLLRDIQRIGDQVKNLAMIELAKSLRQQIQMIARNRDGLNDGDIMLLKDLVEAVKMTIGVLALPNPDIHGLAKTYQKHGQQPQPPAGPLVIPKSGDQSDDDTQGGGDTDPSMGGIF